MRACVSVNHTYEHSLKHVDYARVDTLESLVTFREKPGDDISYDFSADISVQEPDARLNQCVNK